MMSLLSQKLPCHHVTDMSFRVANCDDLVKKSTPTLLVGDSIVVLCFESSLRRFRILFQFVEVVSQAQLVEESISDKGHFTTEHFLQYLIDSFLQTPPPPPNAPDLLELWFIVTKIHQCRAVVPGSYLVYWQIQASSLRKLYSLCRSCLILLVLLSLTLHRRDDSYY